MVKLFVGNLPENTDPLRLRGLFSQHVSVQECDVLKSYAFLHVANESDADKAIKRFNNYKFMGKEIHVERSTSRLRKQPGMGNKCFTCGAVEHKTSQCPGNGRKRNMSNGNQRPYKKPRPLLFDHPPLRHPFPSYNLNPFPPIQNNQHFPVPLVQQHQINHHPPQQQHQQTCWGYKMGSGTENDPELPCPQNPELLKLYEQYMDSRTRYFFYKEQLLKELRLQQQQPTSIPPTSQSLISLNTGGASFNEQSQSVMRVDLTQLSRPKKESDTMQSLSSAPLLPQQQTEQQKFISQQNTSIINNPQALLPPTNPSLINTSAQPLIENSGLNFSSIVSAPQSFQSQQQTAPLQYFSSGTGRIGAPPPTSCYQNTYNALPTNYSTNIAANLPGTSTQPNVSSVKQEPTPLSSIQAFCYN